MHLTFPQLTKALTVPLFIWLLVIPALGQVAEHNSGAKTQPDKKAEEIIARATQAVGGAKYLSIENVVGRGFYTTYQEGISQVPAKFVDYLIYPDRERTEFTSSGIRYIQTNVGETGWLYDGATKTISDMKPEQIDNFKRAMRTSVENLLRGWWREEGATITYAGRREAGLARRNETVRLTYPDGFWVEFEFGARDNLPAKIIYKRTRESATTNETEEVTEEDRIAKLITLDGIAAPLIIDHFRDGVQTSRINYESIEFNRPIPESLFEKPENIKSLK